MRSNKLIGGMLLEAGVINHAQLHEALAIQQEKKEKVGRILVGLGHLTEPQLVAVLSRQLQVSVAPEARLRQVRPPAQALEMVPQEVARTHRILPIFFNDQERSLSLVMADPLDLKTLAEIRTRNQIRQLRVLLSFDSLLDELIDLHYTGLQSQPASPALGAQRYGQPTVLLVEPDEGQAAAMAAWLATERYQVKSLRDPTALPTLLEEDSRALVLLREEADEVLLRAVQETAPSDRIRRFPSARNLVEGSGASAQFVEFYLKTVDFFFSLIEEHEAAPSRHHLRQTSQMARTVAKRLDLSDRQVDTVGIAAYLYQFDEYLTHHGVFGQNTEPEHGKALTAELWSTLQSPLPIDRILKALAQKTPTDDEPMETSVLRAVTTYLEMKDGSASHAKVGHEKALRYLQNHGDSDFPNGVVAALSELLEKEHLIDQLEGQVEAGHEVLLVDKDKTSIRSLELRFVKEGYRVVTARTGEEALRQIESRMPDIVVSEVTLPRLDGFELCAKLKASPETHTIPFIFLSSRADTFHITKGLELGADDFLTKPVNLEILMTKVRRLQRSAESRVQPISSGVQGSLSEMGLFDLLQVLQMGMKTVRVTLTLSGQTCELYLDKGRLVCALLDERKGREAFFDLCTWETGTFAVAPNIEAPEKNLDGNNDYLLMEGMRRADELRAGIGQAGKD